MNITCKYLYKEKNQCSIIPRHNTTEEERAKYCNVEKTIKTVVTEYGTAILDTGYHICPKYKEYKKRYL